MRDPRSEFDAWQAIAATQTRRRPAQATQARPRWWRAPAVALLACVALILAYWVAS